MDDPPRNRKSRRPPRPLDSPRLEELALAYVSRFATSKAKLAAYLRRKLRERGWEGEAEPDIAGLVERHAELGYVDDAAFAAARAGGLLRRGYGERRIAQALGAAGIAEELRDAALPAEAQAREAALALARRRGFGPFGDPFGSGPLDRARREKQIAAMLRAGHPLDSVLELVDCPTVDAAREWAAEAASEEEF